jgi:peptidyl-prolyl cis-trans isomerase D
MLNLMRKHAYSWTIRIVLGVITVVFVFWGIGTGLFNQVHPVATVDGQRILADQLDRESQELRRSLTNMYGAQAAEFLRRLNINEMALERIIERQLVLRQAKRLGLRVSNADLRGFIETNRNFQRDGHFDLPTYEAVLRESDLEPAEFEEMTRTDLTEQLVQNMIGAGINVSDAQARQAYDREHQQVQLTYLELPAADFLSKINPTDQQINQFYKQNSEMFRQPEQVAIAYIRYQPDKLAARINPTDKQIQDFYQRNREAMFSYPERVRARHILIAVAPNASPAVRAQARAKAEKILAQLKAGADFATLANKDSDDAGTNHHGGELGFFVRGQMVKPFEDAAFALKPGQLSGVVATGFGYHIIQVEQVEPAHTDPLTKVRQQIIDQLRQSEARDEADADLHADLAAALNQNLTLQQIAAKRGLTVAQTAPFAANEPISGLGVDNQLSDAAFKLNKGEIGSARTDNNGNFLLQVIKRVPAHVPPLAKIKDQVRDAVVQRQAEAMARAQAIKLLARMKNPSDLDTVARADNLTVRHTGRFDRSSSNVPTIGDFPSLNQTIGDPIKLPELIGRVLTNDGNSYLVRVDSAAAPSLAEWQKAEPHYKEQMLETMRNQAWLSYVDDLKSQARITIDPNALSSAPSQS